MKLIIYSITGRSEMWRLFMIKNLFDFVLVVKIVYLELELQWFERNMYKKGFDWIEWDSKIDDIIELNSQTSWHKERVAELLRSIEKKYG